MPIRTCLRRRWSGRSPFARISRTGAHQSEFAEINANGGLLGRKIELYLEDGATTDAVAQDKVDVIYGGIYSSTRQAIKGPAVGKGRTLYIYPEQYEGQECDPLIFCTGPVPAQQVAPLIPWLIEETGATRWALPSAD